MTINPLQLARVGHRLKGQLALEAISSQNRRLVEVGQQLATGKRILVPSDDPAATAVAQQVRKRLELDERFGQTLRRHQGQLDQADNALGRGAELVRDVRQVALDMANDGVPGEVRLANIEVVNSAYRQLLALANTDVAGSFLFAGDQLDDPPFRAAMAEGVAFVGGDPLANAVDTRDALPFTIDGAAAFGGLAARVRGDADLSPALTAQTRLADLNGARGGGVARGAVRIATTTQAAIVDLSEADSVGDVVAAINNSGVAGVAAGINAAGNGLAVTAAPGVSLTIEDVGDTTARDLDLLVNAAPAGAGVVGGDLAPVLTEFTPVGDLAGGAGVNLADGLVIDLGGKAYPIDFAGAATLGDVLNAIRATTPDLRVTINDAGTGIDVLNTIQGSAMSIRETPGGTTAAALGLRSARPTSPLAELNGGRGLRLDPAGPDVRLIDSAGNQADVDLSGAQTIADAVALLDGALPGVSAALGGDNGITLVDTAGGAAPPRALSLGQSNAAADLGLDVPAAGGAIDGRDVNGVEVPGVFSTLRQLGDALRAQDLDAIRLAAQRLEADEARLITARGKAGALAAEYAQRAEQIETRTVANQRVISELEDVDYPEAVARYQTLQTAIEATYRSTSGLLNLSLLDFLN